MKKLVLSIAVIAAIFATSCKKETTVVTDGEDVVVVDENLVVDTTGLEAEYNTAVAKLEEAKASGDAEAQRLAQEAVDNAKSAWDVAKEKAAETATDIKEGAEATGEKIDAAAENAKAEVKEAAANTKEAVNEAAKDVKNSAKEAKEEAKKDINNALEKAKIK